MEEILLSYYRNNARKLHNMVDKILIKFGGLSGKDMDDFYSLANEVFVDVMNRYDHSQSFDRFLYSCLSNKMKTEMTKRNREKRWADRMSVSVDVPADEEEGAALRDSIPGNFTIEKALFEESEEGYSSRMTLYLSRLSELQREVLRLNTEGYFPNEIREELHMSEKQYADCYAAIHSYRNVSILI